MCRMFNAGEEKKDATGPDLARGSSFGMQNEQRGIYPDKSGFRLPSLYLVLFYFFVAFSLIVFFLG